MCAILPYAKSKNGGYMSVITMVGAASCNQAAVIKKISNDSGYRQVDLKEISTAGLIL
jgi:hypothetical protein